MPLFTIANEKLAPIEQTNFAAEKALHALIEANLQTLFACRLVASEFSTGAQHAGRIDTLALSEDNNPVIIEYKKVESSELINQSLFYLAWLSDHRGDFEIAVQKSLGPKAEVDWSDVRVICIAPNYKKFDLHAVQVMGANIELWTYRFFKNQTLNSRRCFSVHTRRARRLRLERRIQLWWPLARRRLSRGQPALTSSTSTSPASRRVSARSLWRLRNS
jgi:hypothetical protein